MDKNAIQSQCLMAGKFYKECFTVSEILANLIKGSRDCHKRLFLDVARRVNQFLHTVSTTSLAQR